MGSWGIQTSSGASSGGDIGVGGFNFQPKGGSLPPVAWIAIAAVALLLLLKR